MNQPVGLAAWAAIFCRPPGFPAYADLAPKQAAAASRCPSSSFQPLQPLIGVQRTLHKLKLEDRQWSCRSGTGATFNTIPGSYKSSSLAFISCPWVLQLMLPLVFALRCRQMPSASVTILHLGSSDDLSDSSEDHAMKAWRRNGGGGGREASQFRFHSGSASTWGHSTPAPSVVTCCHTDSAVPLSPPFEYRLNTLFLLLQDASQCFIQYHAILYSALLAVAIT